MHIMSVLKKIYKSYFEIKLLFQAICTFYFILFAPSIFNNYWADILAYFSVISLGWYNFSFIGDFFSKFKTLFSMFKALISKYKTLFLNIKNLFSLIKNPFTVANDLSAKLNIYLKGDKMEMGPTNSDYSSSLKDNKQLTPLFMNMNMHNPSGGNGEGSTQQAQTGAAGGNPENTQQTTAPTSTIFMNGFMYDPAKSNYAFNDPTGVSDRPFDAKSNNQPYATFLANGLDHMDTTRRHEDGKVVFHKLQPRDLAYWNAFCKHIKDPNATTYSYFNSVRSRKLLRELP